MFCFKGTLSIFNKSAARNDNKKTFEHGLQHKHDLSQGLQNVSKVSLALVWKRISYRKRRDECQEKALTGEMATVIKALC